MSDTEGAIVHLRGDVARVMRARAKQFDRSLAAQVRVDLRSVVGAPVEPEPDHPDGPDDPFVGRRDW
jgi:hypothetical protein